MAIDLSHLTFTDQNDIVPQSGVEQIVNTGIANTLAGHDEITGTGGDSIGIVNLDWSFFYTDDGDDIITGTGTGGIFLGYGSDFGTGKGNDRIIGMGLDNYGIVTLDFARFNTDDGDDTIEGFGFEIGIINSIASTIDTGKGNDLIHATAGLIGIRNHGTINTGSGEDSITITNINPLANYLALYNYGIIDTGDDDDVIRSTGVIENAGVINTGNGENEILFQGKGKLINRGEVLLGDGDDFLTIEFTDLPELALENFGDLETGDGNDIIFSSGAIYNEGFIKTGNGNDKIIVDGGVNGTGTGYGIYNNGSRIETGDGNDTIIAYDGFKSAPNSSGAWFLGEGDDYIKGFGSGDFYGGNGNDTLELTPGTYTVEIWGEAGESPIFKKGGQLMITSEFETLIAGGTTYDFANLIADQIITVP
jgi:hypothetical protein